MDGVEVQLAMSTVGIDNLGNTCFMNSSLQCLANIPSLREYFWNDAYKDALRVNGKLSEQTQGELAEGFAALLRRLWAGGSRTVAPWDFKRLVARFASQFSGYRQHDSMEFIEYLIDGLKEDCNKVKGKKLYVQRADSDGRPDDVVALEAGNKCLLRNDSVIDDIFVGFLKSMTRCPEPTCNHESVVFDPFLSVKVPLQSQKQCSESSFTVTVVPLAYAGSFAAKHTVSVQKGGNVGDFLGAAARVAGVAPEKCILLELYKGKVYKIFETTDHLEDISASDILLLYELANVQVFDTSTERRWGSGKVVREGDLVEVVAPFLSNNESSQELHKGLHGKVISIDEEGDASIKFDGIHCHQWVFRDNLSLVKTDLNMRSEEQRICPHDGKPYTLSGLVEEWDGEYSLRDLRDYWRDSMKPLGVLDPPPQCAAIVHFRRTLHSERRRELFGIPAVFSMLRDTTVRGVVEAVRAELTKRFGPDAEGGWVLYRADSHLDRGKVESLFWDERMPDGERNNEAWLKEREDLLVEWEGEVPRGVAAALAQVEPRAAEEQEQAVALETCFEWLAEEEQLSASDAVFCSTCKAHRQMYKKVDLWSLPPVLVLQLKRFESDHRARLGTPVRFPLEGLDMRRFCLSRAPSFPPGACLRAGQRVTVRGLQSASGEKLNGSAGLVMYLDTTSARFCVRMQETDPPAEWKRLKPENLEAIGEADKVEEFSPVFDLIAVSKHIGDSRFGHYAAYVRSSMDGKWRLFDDEYVREVQTQEVEAERVGAYVLFYLRRDCRPESWR